MIKEVMELSQTIIKPLNRVKAIARCGNMRDENLGYISYLPCKIAKSTISLANTATSYLGLNEAVSVFNDYALNGQVLRAISNIKTSADLIATPARLATNTATALYGGYVEYQLGDAYSQLSAMKTKCQSQVNCSTTELQKMLENIEVTDVNVQLVPELVVNEILQQTSSPTAVLTMAVTAVAIGSFFPLIIGLVPLSIYTAGQALAAGETVVRFAILYDLVSQIANDAMQMRDELSELLQHRLEQTEIASLDEIEMVGGMQEDDTCHTRE